jgi:hypothetical protein
MYFVSEIGLMLDSSLTLRERTKFFKCSAHNSARGQPEDLGFAGIALSTLKGSCNERELIAYNAQGICPITSEG